MSLSVQILQILREFLFNFQLQLQLQMLIFYNSKYFNLLVNQLSGRLG